MQPDMIHQLEDALLARLGPGDFASFSACAPLLVDFVESGGVLEAVNSMLERSVETRDIDPSFDAKFVVLARNERFTVAVFRLRASSESDAPIAFVSSLSSHEMFLCLRGGPITVRRYREPDGIQPDVLVPSQKIQVVGDGERLMPMTLLAAQAERDLIEFVETKEESLLLRFFMPGISRFVRLYSRETLAPVKIVSASSVDSRIAFAAKVLGELGDPNSLTVLRSLAEHPVHFIRWAALEAVSRIDDATTSELLARFLDDPHPHIRNAAQRTLGLESHLQKA